ncbi:unnamed protein product [Diplocarpon coronariae]
MPEITFMREQSKIPGSQQNYGGEQDCSSEAQMEHQVEFRVVVPSRLKQIKQTASLRASPGYC